MPRRKLPLWFLGLAIACIMSFIIGRRVHQSHLEQAFDDALRGLEQNNVSVVAAGVQRLQGRPGHEAQVHLLRGALLMREGDYQSALGEFAKFTPTGKLRNPTRLLTGKCFYRLGQIGRAETVLRSLVEEDPQNVDGHRWLAVIYFELGAHSPAAEELGRVTELDPADYAPHRLMGFMHMDFEEYQRAIDHFRRALRLSPPADVRQDILVNLAHCLIAVRDYRSAIAVLEGAAPDAVTLARRGECHWSLGEQARAAQLLEQARGLEPQERAVLSLQAQIQMDTDQPEGAVSSLQELLRQHPYDTTARYRLAAAYQQLGDDARYLAELARWQELSALDRRLTALSDEATRDPYDATLREQLADVCAALGKYELADKWRLAAKAMHSAEGRPRVPPLDADSSGAGPEELQPNRRRAGSARSD